MGCGHCSCGGGNARKASGGSALFVGIAAAVVVLVGAAVAFQPSSESKAVEQPAPGAVEKTTPAAAAEVSAYVLDHRVKRIDGTEESLETYKGKVVLIVNVASKCGLTRQYAGLEALYKAKKDQGLVILGFPANNFNNQEPGSNSEIAEFCTSRFSVTFPMFEKVSVKGEQVHPLFKQLASQPAPLGVEPDWNFTKYLVDRQGKVAAHFKARTKPDDEAMVAKIEELLGKK